MSLQVARVIGSIGESIGVKVHVCSRKASILDFSAAQGGVNVIVGTPDRVSNMIQRHVFRTESIKFFIVDDADIVISDGFKEQVDDIYRYMPESVQCAVFSSRMTSGILEAVAELVEDPICIPLNQDELQLEMVKHFYIAVAEEAWKLETLCDLYATLTITQAIIYCNTSDRVDRLAAEMESRDFTVSSIHENVEEKEREFILREFRSGSSRVLTATDFIAIGIDMQQVSLVINYDMPDNPENYFRRVSRVGRFGRMGVAISFVTQSDVQSMRNIEQVLNIQINETPDNVADLT